jgi:pilus assembly protein FimV
MLYKKSGVMGVRNRSLIGALVVLAMGFAPAASHATGLGRLSIFSAIGQPLVGEIELVSVRKEDLSSLSARIASPDAFQDANVQFNRVLVGARVSIERRTNGQPYIRVTSTRPVEEPYIDLLIELTWRNGRLVREYTALMDPVTFAPAQSAPQPPVVAAVPVPRQPPAAAAPAPSAGQKTYGPVQRGDTLHSIARGVQPEGVNLNQVLVGIVRSNPDAFINNNMNLLRTGKILRIPEAADLSKVSAAEAVKEVRVQTADWNAYRQRIASTAPQVAAGESRATAGKIETSVQDTGAAGQAPAKEVVKISKGAAGEQVPGADKSVQERIRVLEEEVTAREKDVKDAAERIASLEKTIKDMQRLLELRGAAAPPATAVTPPTPVAESKPAPKPVAPPPAPPVAAEWWQDPTVLGGGLLGLGVLGGAAYLLARRRRESADFEPVQPVTRRTPPTAAAPAAAAAGAVAAAATTTTQMPAQTAAAAAAADEVDPIAEADVYIAYGRDAQAEEILKEALTKNPGRQELKVKLLEIYAARKSKAEFNTLAGDVHTATGARGDLWMRVATMGFVLDPANALYAAGKDSAGFGPIGVQTDVNLDFDLDMVSAAGAPSTVTDLPLSSGQDEGDNVTTTVLSPERMAQLRAEGAGQASESGQRAQPPATDGSLDPNAVPGSSVDINLDIPPATGNDANVIDFDFDPAKTANMEAPSTTTFEPDRTIVIPQDKQEKTQDLEADIDIGGSGGAKDSSDAANEAPADPASGELSLDLNLPPVEAPPTIGGAVPPTDIQLDVPEFKPADTAAMDFALDTVSFDLGTGATRDAAPAADAPAHDEHWYDVQTKFDLAKAYQEMGDKDGAREILAEVIKDGDAQQQAEAKELLEKLA